MKVSVLLAIATITSVPVHAELAMQFVESAPKDRFVLTNVGDCELTDLRVSIDLGESAGGLIFDTTGQGAGVEVFQPFEVRSGDVKLDAGTVSDGDTELAVQVARLPAGETASFTIDVDDTLRNSDLGQIRVAGSEIAGAVVSVSDLAGRVESAVFSEDSKAVLAFTGCAS